MILAALAAASSAAEAKENWPQPALGPSVSGDPEVLFTFDDGPDDKITPRILDALHRHGVQAVFFVAGWRLRGRRDIAERRREVARDLLAAGHMIGNHTVNHVKLCSIEIEEGALEIDDNARLLAQFANMPVTFFRVPYGSRCRRVDTLLGERGLHHLHWDMDPHEYLTQSATDSVEYLIEQLRRLQGRAVILLHDTQPTTARTLPAILDWIALENERRVRDGERPIRILSYADIAWEQFAPGVVPLLDRVTRSARGFAPDVARQLLAPLAGPAPRHAAQL
jgi:peptidoglycan/xylan/chitin deacetylase (PgdA/CDA1 family)